MCTALVVGNTIGIGIFLLPASLAPYGYNAMIGWVITVVGCVALARVFARLARDMPAADGPYGYIRSTLGDIPAFLAMWSYWVVAVDHQRGDRDRRGRLPRCGVPGAARACRPRCRRWRCCGCSC